jgi:hypothetical protein
MSTIEFPLPSLSESFRRILTAIALVCSLGMLLLPALADGAVTLLHTLACAEGGSASTLVQASDGNY